MNKSFHDTLEMSYMSQQNKFDTSLNINDSVLQPILVGNNLINAVPVSPLIPPKKFKKPSENSTPAKNMHQIPKSSPKQALPKYPEKVIGSSPEGNKNEEVMTNFTHCCEKKPNEAKSSGVLPLKESVGLKKEERAKTYPKRTTKIFEMVSRFIANLKISVKRRIIKRLKMYHYQILDENLFDQKDFKEKNNNVDSLTNPSINEHVYKEKDWKRAIRNFNRKILKFVQEKVPIFSPDHKLLHFWDFFMLFFLIINIANIPLVISFDLSENDYYTLIWIILEDVPVWIFLCDILITLNTSYYHKGVFILSRRQILKKYLKNNFTLDSLTIIPFFLAKIIKLPYVDVLFLLRVFRLRRLFNTFNEYLELPKPYNSVFDLIKLCFYVVYIAHVLGCIWHYIGISEVNAGQEKTWLHSANIATDDWKTRYITSLYWAITTMITVGYGDIVPVTPFERLTAIFLMVISSGFFAYSLNSIGSIVQELYHEEVHAFKSRFLHSRNVSKNLQVKVKRYLDYMNEEQNQLEARNGLFNRLSDSLKQEILYEMYKDMVKEHPLLKHNFSKEFLSAIIPKIKEVTLAPDETVFRQNDNDEKEIFFVIKGEVELCVLRDSEKHPLVLKVIKKHQSFGEYSFLTSYPREISARCTQVTILGFLTQQEFLNIAKTHYSYDFERFYELRDKIIVSQDYSTLNKTCLSCCKETHDFPMCDVLRYIPRREKIIDRHKQRQNIKEKTFPRREAKTLNARILKRDVEQAVSRLKDSFVCNDTITSQSENEEESSGSQQFLNPYQREDSESNTTANEKLRPKKRKSICEKSNTVITERANLISVNRKLTVVTGAKFKQNSGVFTPKSSEPELVSPFRPPKIKLTNICERKNEVENSLANLNLAYINDAYDSSSPFNQSESNVYNAQTVKQASSKKRNVMDSFDAMRLYQNYFPHNNFDMVIKQINMNVPQITLKRKSTFGARKKFIKKQIDLDN